MTDRTKIDAAQAGFKKLLRDQDGKNAMSEYEAQTAAVRAKTTRLRALRLARHAAEGKAPVEEAAPKKKAGKSTRQSGNLSDWLKDREGSGHNN